MTKAGHFAHNEREGHGAGAPNNRAFSQQPQALRCANCDIEIAWAPTISDSLAYCCPGCARGGPCSCDYSEHANTSASDPIPQPL